MTRVGFGFDAHQLQEGIPFTLGGITISHSKGAVGHSDADVLIHAICDALLGAAALGDIGQHFPDSSEEYKNIDSKILLLKVVELLKEKDYTVVNIDSTICLEQPKIAPHIPLMQETLSETMDIGLGQVSIKATTTEKMGFIGREEGVAAYAVCLIEKN
jgi:2-C-methyl-D-erythritol 2,4-cyclodiphosphate synthase